MRGQYDLVKWMLVHLGKACCGGEIGGLRKALTLAASFGRVEIMQLLAEFNVCSPWDLGPALLNAVHSSQEESVKFLLKFDDYFDVHIQNALICAVRAYTKGCASSRMMRRLLDASAKTKDGNVLKIVAKLRREETEEIHVQRLDAIYRLLRQDDAVHSESFLWPPLSSPCASAFCPVSFSCCSSTSCEEE